MKPAMLGLAAILLLTWFSGEIDDTDIWLHLMTGRHMVEHRALAVPDPFSYTSNIDSAQFPGEATTRYFNLTHEWLAQIVMYLIYSAAGYPALVVVRALLLVAFCGLCGLIVWWRTGGFYRSILAALTAGAVAIDFQQSRPYLITFLSLAITMAIVERRRWMWTLPALFLIWANCHGGFFMGWMMIGAYCLEAFFRREPWQKQRDLWFVAGACVVASAINPNGLRVFEILLKYRQSNIQTHNLEWQHSTLWDGSAYGIVLLTSLLMILISRKRTRPVDWILFFVFGTASLLAFRNTLLMGLVGAVLLFAYVPQWKWLRQEATVTAVPVLLVFSYLHARPFQFRAAEWMLPSTAADFLQQNHIKERIFNMYESGGYLIWRLWPAQKAFIDPRGLSEQVYLDYGHVLVDDPTPGQSREEILRKYDIGVLVLAGFNRYTGNIIRISATLADPKQTEWKLVLSDEKGAVFMRTPPPGVQALDNLEALHSIELQCQSEVAHNPEHKGCIRAVSAIYDQIGDASLAARWNSWLQTQ
jgi:hypothetical protein